MRKFDGFVFLFQNGNNGVIPDRNFSIAGTEIHITQICKLRNSDINGKNTGSYQDQRVVFQPKEEKANKYNDYSYNVKHLFDSLTSFLV